MTDLPHQETSPSPVVLATKVMLDNDHEWQDRHGRVHSIADMSTRYRAGVVEYLERRVLMLTWHYSLAETIWLASEDLGRFEFELSKRIADPIAWLHSTPLVRALEANREDDTVPMSKVLQ